MIRKAVIVTLTLGAVGAVAIEMARATQSCPVPQGASPVNMACPLRLYLGRSEQGAYRFVYAVSESWYSSVGYLRLKGQMDDGFDAEEEAWFHAMCVAPLRFHGGIIPYVVWSDDVFPSHVFARGIVMPRGLFLVSCAAYPAIAFIRGPLRRYRRRKRGLCVACGYDMRGSEGRCSECGKDSTS